MNRRDFLKGCFASVTVAAMPALALEALHPERVKADPAIRDKFDPDVGYENSFILNEEIDLSTEPGKKLFELVEEDMRSFIPPKYWDNVEYMYAGGSGYDDPLGELFTLSWKYKP